MTLSTQYPNDSLQAALGREDYYKDCHKTVLQEVRKVSERNWAHSWTAFTHILYNQVEPHDYSGSRAEVMHTMFTWSKAEDSKQGPG